METDPNLTDGHSDSKPRYRGLFISFEGIDGSGKSVQAERLYRNLQARHRAVRLIREPGGTEISERIRSILLDSRHRGMGVETELFLYEAARAQLVAEIIRPELNRGHAVITDRYADSTVAYQAYGRNLSRELVDGLNRVACAGVFPDRTYFLDIPIDESRRRMESVKKTDRMETETREFYERVRQGYVEIARAEPERILLLDGTMSIETLERDILQNAMALLDSVESEPIG